MQPILSIHHQVIRFESTARSLIYYLIVLASLPVVRVMEGQLAIIEIPIADWDGTNSVQCRWASSTGVLGDECGDACENIPNANISQYVYYFQSLLESVVTM